MEKSGVQEILKIDCAAERKICATSGAAHFSIHVSFKVELPFCMRANCWEWRNENFDRGKKSLFNYMLLSSFISYLPRAALCVQFSTGKPNFFN